MLAAVRSFFSSRNVLEVDTPLLQESPPIDPFIDIFEVPEGGFLHSSPEYGMKRLLAHGCGDIYQLSHVFRKGEKSSKHRVEFSLVEWYRLGKELDFLIQETIDLCSLFIGKFPSTSLSYEEAFGETPTDDYCIRLLKKQGIPLPENGFEDLAWALVVEPSLPKDTFVAITDFPPHHAALAQCTNGKAERFELYFNGHELANGYNELQTAEDYRTRLLSHNERRDTPLPFPEDFLDAIYPGLPPCVGVAVGFDRLMMLRHNAPSIETILPIPH